MPVSRLLFLTSWVLLLSFGGVAQNSLTEKPLENSLLWEISGNGLDQPSYVFGTIHSADERAFRFGDHVMANLEKCDAVVGEIVIKESFASLTPQALLMEEPNTLKSLTTEEEYEELSAALKKQLGSGAILTEKMKPFFISALLMEQSMEVQGKQPKVLDDYLQSEAYKMEKEVLGLETIEEQMAAIDKVSLEKQVEMLLEYIREFDKQSDMWTTLIEAYEKQDLQAMETLYEEEGMGSGFDEALVVERNKTMSDRMEDLMKAKSCFFAIGALHLPGETGVIRSLRAKGYQVNPVKS